MYIVGCFIHVTNMDFRTRRNLFQSEKFVLFLFVFCTGNITAETPTVYKYIYERPATADNDIAPEMTIFRSWGLSLLTCSMLCTTQTQCVSFAYSETTGTCSGGRTRIPFPSELTESPGFRFFIISESCAYPRLCVFDSSYTCQCDDNCNTGGDCCFDKRRYCPKYETTTINGITVG